MPQQSRRGVWIAVVVFIGLAIALKVFGGPIYKALLAMHGRQ